MLSRADLARLVAEAKTPEQIAKIRTLIVAYKSGFTAWDLWLRRAHTKQVVPGMPGSWDDDDDWRVCYYSCGRAFGKTTGGSQWAAQMLRDNPGKTGAAVVPTHGDGLRLIVDGEAGLRAALGAEWDAGEWRPSEMKFTHPNGAVVYIMSSQAPDRLRGLNLAWAWCDEVSSWKDAHLPPVDSAGADTTWMILRAALRSSPRAKTLVTSTPKPVRLLTGEPGAPGLMRGYPKTKIVYAATFDNPYLPAEFIEAIQEEVTGRLARQELYGELIEEVAGALWSHDLVNSHRHDGLDHYDKVIVAVDPAKGSGRDMTGIVVIGLGTSPVNGKPAAFVLEDLSARVEATRGVDIVARACRKWDATEVVIETTGVGQGFWEVAQLRVRDESDDLDGVRLHEITPTEAKKARAEKVAGWTEQDRVFLCGTFPELESQMTTWVPGPRVKSPDQLDAFVHGARRLIGSAAKADVYIPGIS